MIPINPGEVHIWVALSAPIVDRQQLPKYESLLSDEERARCARFYFERDRTQFTIAHGLVRMALAQCTGVPPAELQFQAGPGGKPHLVATGSAEALEFNLTHTTGLSACAVCRQLPVGIDAEDASRKVDYAVARKFAKQEQEYLDTLDMADRQEPFFAYWTLKEAYMKALGLGLTLPLNSFAIDLEGPSVASTENHPMVTTDWRFFQTRPSPTHRLAVCVQESTDFESRFIVNTAESLESLF